MIKKLTIPLAILIMFSPLMAKTSKESIRIKKYTPPKDGAVKASAVIKKNKSLRDGFALEGIDGKLIEGKNNRWLFVLDSELRDDQNVIPAGTELEILYSTALEKIASDAKADASKNYRIWGNLTRYGDENYIFLIYSLAITTAVQEAGGEPNKSSLKPAVNDPNDELLIPEEIVKKLKVRKFIQPEQLSKGFQLKQDYILANRTGFIVPQADGKYLLKLDAMGQNIENISIPLLYCQTLEKAAEKQKSELERTRWKISGIITQFKGEKYLLVQQATKVYSHGNFGR